MYKIDQLPNKSIILHKQNLMFAESLGNRINRSWINFVEYDRKIRSWLNNKSSTRVPFECPCALSARVLFECCLSKVSLQYYKYWAR